MRKHLPPLRSLISLEACVRLGTITAAAEELALTQSAVSRQILRLEQQLDVQLLQRQPGHIQPTQACLRYLESIQPLLDGIERATIALCLDADTQPLLQIAAPPTFAAVYLIPLLAEYRKAHPEVLVMLVSHIGSPNTLSRDIALAIHYEEEHNGDWRDRALFAERVLPVVAAGEAASIETQTLLQLASRPNMWQDWLGDAPPRGRLGPKFAHFPMLVQAARSGLGCALLPDFAAAEALRSGQLQALDQAREISPRHYQIALARHGHAHPQAEALWHWLAEALN